MKFTLEDFPIGSTAYFYKIADVQNNPRKRQAGEKRFRKELVFFKFTVAKHKGKTLIASEHCDYDSGYDILNTRFEKERFLLIPEYLHQDINHRAKTIRLSPKQQLFLLLREPGCVNEEINEIVLNARIELEKPWFNKVFYKDLKKTK